MKKSLFPLSAVLLLMVTLFSSCASIFSKTSYPIAINADPQGATISITNKKGVEIFNGTAPTAVSLKAGAGFFVKAAYQITISAPGYSPKTASVVFKLNGLYFGNILLGGVIGMVFIDPATGAMWKTNTTTVNAILSKATSALTTPTLQLVDVRTLPENVRKQLVRIN